MKGNIKLLVMDVDGVLTDGKITYNHEGEEIKSFHVRDGYGLKLLHQAGIKTAIITGRKSAALLHRTKDLNIEHVHMGISDKLPVLKSISEELNVPMEHIAYVGDDLPDLEVMQTVACPITVADADETIKTVAQWVTKKKGGEGAIREVCNWILNND